MKTFIATAAVCLLLLLSYAPRAAEAQTRTRRSVSTAQKRRGSPATGTRLDQTRFNAQRLELAGLSKDMTRFLYLYGRLSKDLELTGAQSADAASQTKAGLIRSMGDMRDRLDQLESHFRFEQGLETQYRALQGVSAGADQAVQMANANRFDQAGKKLLEVASQLTDALMEMQ